MRNALIVLGAFLALASCTMAGNTPTQDLAWERWKECDKFPTIRLKEITQQGSIFAGFTDRTGSWIRDTAQADLWIMDPQVEFTEDRKAMLDNALLKVRGVEGIEWAVPMYKSYVQARVRWGIWLAIESDQVSKRALRGRVDELAAWSRALSVDQIKIQWKWERPTMLESAA